MMRKAHSNGVRVGGGNSTSKKVVTAKELTAWFVEHVALEHGTKATDVDSNGAWEELGFDSLQLIALATGLQKFIRKWCADAMITPIIFVDYPTITQLAAHLGAADPADGAESVVTAVSGAEDATMEKGAADGAEKAEKVPEEVLRVLCLHGFRMNADLFRWQAKGLVQKLESELQKSSPKGMTTRVEWLFADAPHAAMGGGDPAIPKEMQPRLREWYSRGPAASNASAGEDDPNGYLHGWRGPEYVGLAESVSDVEALQEVHGPIHGVIGFSQGAALASLLLARAEQARSGRGNLWSTPLIDLRWGMFFSGVGIGTENGRKWLHQHELLAEGRWPVRRLPTLHVYDPGEEWAEECRMLAKLLHAKQGGDKFTRRIKGEGGQRASGHRSEAAASVLHHSQGHLIPKGAEMTQLASAWFAPFIRANNDGREREAMKRNGVKLMGGGRGKGKGKVGKGEGGTKGG
jgi:hypothetical protein